MAVILSIKEYQELLEDLHDLAVVAERCNEPVVDFEEIKKNTKIKRRRKTLQNSCRKFQNNLRSEP